nr:hypothetical protein [Paenibacillus guangzhouensis]
MNTYIEQASQHIRLQEGPQVIEQLLLECYLNPGISTKELARKTLLPTPVAAAIKRELIKAGALVQERGVRCTTDGLASIEQEWGYRGLNHSLYHDLLNESKWSEGLKDTLAILEELLSLRPSVDVQIDQSKCTPETSLRRAACGQIFSSEDTKIRIFKKCERIMPGKCKELRQENTRNYTSKQAMPSNQYWSMACLRSAVHSSPENGWTWRR